MTKKTKETAAEPNPDATADDDLAELAARLREENDELAADNEKLEASCDKLSADLIECNTERLALIEALRVTSAERDALIGRLNEPTRVANPSRNRSRRPGPAGRVGLADADAKWPKK